MYVSSGVSRFSANSGPSTFILLDRCRCRQHIRHAPYRMRRQSTRAAPACAPPPSAPPSATCWRPLIGLTRPERDPSQPAAKAVEQL